tara:strand:- start:299 stop:1078 length:780 start_codon:yes stop_codon:yes gene_type:complete
MNDYPYISILTPTFNRRKFLPLMITNIIKQNYPKDKIEWVICDSWGMKGDKCDPMLTGDEVHELTAKMEISINYSFLKTPMGIGEKRNWLTKKAKHNILINMDSDDIYFEDYCKVLVDTLKGKVSIAGSPEMLFIFPDENYKMGIIRCPAFRQIHEGAMGYTKKHFRRMGGFASSGTGEGAKMFDGCGEQCFKKVPICELMVCVCHDGNTCSKDRFKKSIDPKIKLQGAQFEVLQEITQIPYDEELVLLEESEESLESD